MSATIRPTAPRFDARDALSIALVLVVLAIYVVRTFDFTLVPYEDAAILMRYSDHLARGYGIVWNIGEAPVDGATDFFLMFTLAMLGKLGMTIDMATYVLGFASHALTVALIYVGVRNVSGAPRWMAVLSALFLALGAGVRYVEAYFGTPYFALFSAMAWVLATRAYWRGESTRVAIGFACSGLLLGLTRPEGVFLAAFMLVALVATRGFAASRKMLLWFAAIFGVFGSAYFVWHWKHFGYPLPNTYYIKGSGTLHWGHLMGGVRHIVALALPLLPLLVYAVLAELAVARRFSRDQVFVFLPLVLFTVLGVLHEGLMDYLHRFQYGLLPIVLIGWPVLLMRVLELWRGDENAAPSAQRTRLAAVLAALFCVGSIAYQVDTFPAGRHKFWGTHNVAQILADYSTDYTIAVTNAGHLPYVSGWKAIDAWGLNDQTIAHDGLSEAFLDRYKPEVVQFDDRYEAVLGESKSQLPWAAGTRVLRAYVAKNDYVLAAAFGVSPYKTHYYYVRRGFPESEEIARRIATVDYYIGGFPTRCFDYSRLVSD